MKSFLTKALVLTLLTGTFLQANLRAEEDFQPNDSSRFAQITEDDLDSLPVAPIISEDEELIIEEPIETTDEVLLDD